MINTSTVKYLKWNPIYTDTENLDLVSAWSRSCKRKVFFLDMVFNKVQFSQLVINEYVQLWYQLLIQIILYHGNPN